MNVLAWILGVVLAATFGVSGITKLLDLDRIREHLGYTRRTYQLIGLSEVAGAAAMIVALVWKQIEWIGGAAGIGIICLMVGALIAHARVDDEGKKVIPALVMLVLAAVYVVALSLR